ncbi:Hypp453 [Branchiostoma lanceolatum]|uniref:Hypp453 protein n=1 Tax=Branchiostoma lanceolatum TaxID=7740 RepID=A0A8J9YJF1_BRALA|nr:Hypp453 [Branchiostoma lanceolatum]
MASRRPTAAGNVSQAGSRRTDGSPQSPQSFGGRRSVTEPKASQPPTRPGGAARSNSVATGRSRRTRKESAVYRPLTSSQSRWRPTQPAASRATARSMQTITERSDTDSMIGSPVAERLRYVIPEDDPQLQRRMGIIQRYLHEKKLTADMKELCGMLLSMPDLPYNPYPGFVRRLRRNSEKFHMFREDNDDKITQLLENPTYATSLGYVSGVKGYNNVWGLSTILRCVDPGALRQYEWLLDDLTPKESSIHKEEGYSCQVLMALVGQSVFTSTFYPHPDIVAVRVSYVSVGPDAEQGISMFVDSVANDVNNMDNQNTHVYFGVSVPTKDEEFPGLWENVFWDQEMVLNNQGDFWNAISEATVNNKMATFEGVFRVDPFSDTFRRGQKQYELHFIEVSEKDKTERLVSFAEFPLGTLHEGVFLQKSHAEAYLNIFMPRHEVMDKDQPPPSMQPRYKSDLSKNDQAEDKDESKGGKKKSKDKQVKKRTKEEEKRDGEKGEEEGFVGSSGKYGPDSWQVKSPIREHIQRKIASMHPEAEVFDVAYNAILLILMDRNAYQPTALIQIYRLLRSTAARLSSIMEHNNMLRSLVAKYEGVLQSHFVQGEFKKYKDALLGLLDSSLLERSSDMNSAHIDIQQRFTGVIGSDDAVDPHSIPLNKKTLSILRSINQYCSCIQLQLIEDCLIHAPILDEIIQMMYLTFPEEMPRPQTRQMERRQDKKKKKGAAPLVSEIFTHGAEDPDLLKHDKLAVDVEIGIERASVPKVIAVEAVLMQYMVDTKLDETWHDFLVELLCGAYLPPNPYPRFVTAMRQSALKMELWTENPERLVQKLVHRSERMIDPDNYIYHIPGTEAYGHVSALMILDIGHFRLVSNLADLLVNQEAPKRRGSFKIFQALGIAGASGLYGRMAPYLLKLELHEHTYFKGPKGCSGEALQSYLSIVYDHLIDLYRTGTILVYGVFLGDSGERWSIHAVIQRKNAFMAELERTLQCQEPAFVKVFVVQEKGWRYVPVEKHFLLHYVEDDEDQVQRYFPYNTASLYQNIFLVREKARFHFVYGGPEDNQDPFTGPNLRAACMHVDHLIKYYLERNDLLSVYRWLTSRALMHQHMSYLPDCWRMQHSPAATVEYLNTLNMNMQELVLYELERTGRMLGEHDVLVGNQLIKLTQPEEDESPLNTILLGKMANAYRQKVNVLLKSAAAMAPRSLEEMVQSKLQIITERDPITKELFLLIDGETLKRLQDVRDMMQHIQDSVVNDVHNCCREAQQAIKVIAMETQARTSRQRVTLESGRSTDGLSDSRLRIAPGWSENDRVSDDRW